MPPFTEADLHDSAVLWALDALDEYSRPVLLPPRTISCRWEKVRKEVMDSNGRIVALAAQVMVAEEIKVGSQMWLGTLTEWSGSGSAAVDDEVMHVVMYDEIPSVDNRERFRMVSLSRYAAKLGTLA